jgi:hypothetical protein
VVDAAPLQTLEQVFLKLILISPTLGYLHQILAVHVFWVLKVFKNGVNFVRILLHLMFGSFNIDI